MPAPNFQDRTLFHGDNLDFLRGMNSETVRLIAPHPPFNKSSDFHAHTLPGCQKHATDAFAAVIEGE